MYTQSFIEKFRGQVDESGNCHEWNGSVNKTTGYGYTNENGKTYRCHVVSYQISKGEVPPRMCVMHTCDNRKCVNPNHLKVGTYSDNMKDMFQKNRGCTGNGNDRSIKLSIEDVHNIRWLHEHAYNINEIVDITSFKRGTIYDIVAGKTWKDV